MAENDAEKTGPDLAWELSKTVDAPTLEHFEGIVPISSTENTVLSNEGHRKENRIRSEVRIQP